MVKRGLKPPKGVEKVGGEGEKSHTNIATRGLTSRLKRYESFSAWAPPQIPVGELTTLPRPPSLLVGCVAQW